eukprot:3225346-Rhodomonas_salina.3
MHRVSLGHFVRKLGSCEAAMSYTVNELDTPSFGTPKGPTTSKKRKGLISEGKGQGQYVGEGLDARIEKVCLPMEEGCAYMPGPGSFNAFVCVSTRSVTRSCTDYPLNTGGRAD